MNKDKIIQEISGFQDVATDFKDVWSDLNNILDYEIVKYFLLKK